MIKLLQITLSLLQRSFLGVASIAHIITQILAKAFV